MDVLEEMRATEIPLGTVPLQGRRCFDRSDEIIWMGLAQSPLLNIMSRKMMKKMTDDPEYKHWPDLELTYKGTLEGSNSAGTVDAAISTSSEDSNYIEIFKCPWSATDTELKTNFYRGNDFQHRERKARDSFLRTIERKFLLGHKYQDFVDGEPRRTTGGVLEYILGGNDTVYDSTKDMVNGDGSERYWKIGATSNLTKANINKFVERLFNYGNPDKNKVAFCAPGFLTIFQDLFDSSLRLQNGETSYKLAITRYESSHGVLDLVADPVFYDLHKYDVIVLDTEYVAYRFIPDMDIHIDKGPNGKGIQANDAKRMTYQMYAQIGVDITFKNAHAFITGYNG